MTLPEMALKSSLKARRAREAAHKPFGPSRFTVVSAIITAYGLGRAFLRHLDNPGQAEFDNPAKSARLKEKPELELPLFFLGAQADYLLTAAIMEKLNNPYLDFARDPEELILSAPLFRVHPGMPPEMLRGRHFAALLADELEKAAGPSPP